MEILHLSDLHLTGEHKERFPTLDALWSGPSSALGNRKFDFIVVSGDLSQSAKPKEYEDLLSFSKKTLLPLIRYQKDAEKRKRVIFVPGNHDVDWKHEFSKELEIDDDEERSRKIRSARRRPTGANLRVSETDEGSELHEIQSPETYAKRFANVQSFLEQFYGSALETKTDHMFDLCAPADKGKDWSLHTFPRQRIAFVGLNSCFRNDKFWRGAQLNAAAVRNAQKSLQEVMANKDWLVVGVWHHGLTTSQGHPDHLTLQDLSLVHTLSCRVAFHGHTHKSSSATREFVGRRLLVISTGSIGADRDDRPERVTNQFSIVSLLPTRLAITIHNRQAETAAFEPEKPQQFELDLLQGAPALDSERFSVGTHTRSCTIRDDGILETKVELQNIRVQGGCTIPLAFVNHPIGGHEFDARVESSSGGNITISKTGTGGARGIAEAPCSQDDSKWSWSYRLSNGAILTRSDFELMDRRWMTSEHAPEGCEVVGHATQFLADALVLQLKFETRRMTSFAPLVERRVIRRGRIHWESAPTEASRCRLRKLPHGRGATLKVEAPYVGYRYSIVYRPTSDGEPIDAALGHLSRRILHLARNSRPVGEIATVLTEGLGSQVGQVLRAHSLDDASPRPKTPLVGCTWCGFLWDHSRRQLAPAFGEFPSRGWGASFAAGHGVAGHAFRFSRPAAYHTRYAGTSRLFYVARADESEEQREFSWILAIPIVIEADGPSIGVVAFSSEVEQPEPGTLAVPLHEAAESLASTKPDGDVIRLLQILKSTVAGFFWQAAARSELTSPKHARRAAAVIRALHPPTGADTLGQ